MSHPLVSFGWLLVGLYAGLVVGILIYLDRAAQRQTARGSQSLGNGSYPRSVAGVPRRPDDPLLGDRLIAAMGDLGDGVARRRIEFQWRAQWRRDRMHGKWRRA